MFKVNNKDTRMTPLASIVNFEHVILPAGIMSSHSFCCTGDKKKFHLKLEKQFRFRSNHRRCSIKKCYWKCRKIVKTCVRFSSVGWDANWNKKLTDDKVLRSARLVCFKKLCIYYKKCFTIFVISAVGLQLFAHTLVLHHLNMVLKIKCTLKAKRCINL